MNFFRPSEKDFKKRFLHWTVITYLQVVLKSSILIIFKGFYFKIWTEQIFGLTFIYILNVEIGDVSSVSSVLYNNLNFPKPQVLLITNDTKS